MRKNNGPRESTTDGGLRQATDEEGNEAGPGAGNAPVHGEGDDGARQILNDALSRAAIDLILVEKGFYVFAPKAGSKKDLKAQYPELLEYPEFKSDRLKSGDALFVWFMRCRMSPWYDVADEKKMELCVRASYETVTQQENKIMEYANMRFPDSVKAAMGRMEKFNTHARIENYVYTRTVRDACKSILAKDVKSMKPLEVDIWLGQAKVAWKLLQETAASIEGHIGGVIEEEEVGFSNTEGGVNHFRQNRK